jgi:hypothetical protein
VTRRGEGPAGLALTIVTRALPLPRKEWGRAMRAELAAIDEPRARRRFVRGCVRAVLLTGTTLRALAGYAAILGFAAVILRAAAELPSPGVRAEATGLVAIIAVLAWCGRRRVAGLGPVGPTPAARLARLIGYATVMTTVGVLLTTGTNDPAGWWLAAVAVNIYLAGFLRITTQPVSHLLSLPIAATLTLAGLTVWWIPMLLRSGVRAAPPLTFLVALALIPAGWALGSRTGSPTRGLRSGLAAATATFLLIFLAAVLTYRLAPDLVPNISGPGDAGGLTPAAKADTNRIESIDPYVADFLLGAILSAGTVLTTRPAQPGAVTGRGAG